MASSPSLVEAFIASYGEAGLTTLKVLIAAIKDRNERFGKSSHCITYEYVRKWITFRKLNVKFTTIERAMRKLAEGGVLKRKKVGRKDVIFCLNEEHPMVWYLMNSVKVG